MVCQGYGFLPLEDADYLIEPFFKHHLEELTRNTKGILPNIEETNELLSGYLEQMDNLLIQEKNYAKVALERNLKLNLSDLDANAYNHFPLCMKEMHDHVRKEHHLRHTGRVQYTLFLKGIGLPLDDVIKFWRGELTKKIPNEKFERSYVYNIKH